MAEPSTNPREESLDALSHRVTAALDEDAQRRRWTTRLFFVLAVIPVLIALTVFFSGISDIQQTEQIATAKIQSVVDDVSKSVTTQVSENITTTVSQQMSQTISKKIAAQVSKEVTASVAGELQDAREVSALLPTLRSAAKALPQVQENQRALSATRSQIDVALEQQKTLQQSLAAATDELSNLPKQISGMETRIAQAVNKSDSAQASITSALKDIHADTQVLQQRIKSTEGKITRDAKVEQSITDVHAQIKKTREALMHEVNTRIKAIPTSPNNDNKRLRSIEARLDSLPKQSRRLQSLESAIRRIPKTPVDISALQRSIKALSQQVEQISTRVKTLEGSRATSGTGNVSAQLRAVQDSLQRMNKNISGRLSGIEKRLSKLEQSRLRSNPSRVIR